MPVWHCLCLACLCTLLNPIAGAINDHSQSAKDENLYFKSQLYVKDPDHQKPVLILPNWLNNPGERAHDRYFNFYRWWNSDPQPLDRQSSVLLLRFHRSPKYVTISRYAQSNSIWPWPWTMRLKLQWKHVTHFNMHVVRFIWWQELYFSRLSPFLRWSTSKCARLWPLIFGMDQS